MINKKVNKAKEKKKSHKIVKRYDTVKAIEYLLRKDGFNGSSSEDKIEFVSRPELKKYLGMGNLEFYAIFGFQTSLIDGAQVALLQDVRDPLNHNVITDHVWVRINNDISVRLSSIRQLQPVKVIAKVVKYHGEKIGLRVNYITLVKGQRNYCISSKRVEEG